MLLNQCEDLSKNKKERSLTCFEGGAISIVEDGALFSSHVDVCFGGGTDIGGSLL